MLFDNYDCGDAEGVILAHTIRIPGKIFKKGMILSCSDLESLQENGHYQVPGVRLEAGDVDENRAALEVARALAGTMLDIGKPVAGRCYLYAQQGGLAAVNREIIDRINLSDSGVFVATLAEHAECLQQQAIASIKVIPFAIARETLNRVLDHADAAADVIALQAFRSASVALILTETDGLKESLISSTSRVTRERVTSMGGNIVFEKRCDHTVLDVTSALTEALGFGVDLVLICGASVTADTSDIVPLAIVGCGGVVDHFGMPVEPGNMLLLAHIGDCPVINLPGCSRSPKLNGLDWVMQRMAAGLTLGKAEILSMGVGGLIKDISHRRRMRERSNLIEQFQPPHKVAAIVLAAGHSRRMGEPNKLLLRVGDDSMIQRVVDSALKAEVFSTTVVTGCQANEVLQQLKGREILSVHNAAYREGIASSLKQGLSSLPKNIDGVMILLADMPFISSAHINQLIAEFDPATERDIVAPLREGRLGNPIIWSTRYVPAMMKLKGDRGARQLLDEFAANVWEVPMGDDAIFMDVDTPALLVEANQRWERGAMNGPHSE